MLEFLGLPGHRALLESSLEQGLMDKLQAFLLELGKGFAFVARQQRVSTESKDFYIDLVFYNHLLKCFVLIMYVQDNSVVRYSVLDGSEQLFASRDKLVLPSEEELRIELVREAEMIRHTMEMGAQEASGGDKH